MPDPNEIILKNLINLERLANGVVGVSDGMIRDLFDEMVAKLAKIDPTAPKSKAWQQARADKWVKLVRSDSRKAFRQIYQEMRTELAKIGVHQAGYARSLLGEVAGAGVSIGTGPTSLALMSVAVDDMIVRGGFLKDWLAKQADSSVDQALYQIRLGIIEGETIGDMIRRVRGTQTGWRYRDPKTGKLVKRGTKGAKAERVFRGGVMQTTTKQAEALVRTATRQIATEAHQRTYLANDDITEEYIYDATLDGRTTPICRSLDGNRYRYDDPNKRLPPQHWQCRSTHLPITDGVDPREYGKRAAEGGPVPGTYTYNDWLKSQSQKKQNEVLGPSRAKLWRDGKVSLQDMVRKDGSVIRLDDLDV